jgi:rare lipoprotein A
LKNFVTALGAAALLVSTAGVASAASRHHHHHHHHHLGMSHHEMGHQGGGMNGIASIYSPTYSGQPTASGQHGSPHALTAAHKTLPFGTMVRVTNQHNGRTVMVRINDRGPFVRGRIIDLSPAAAQALGVDGVVPVSLSVGKTGRGETAEGDF